MEWIASDTQFYINKKERRKENTTNHIVFHISTNIFLKLNSTEPKIYIENERFDE